MRGESFLVSKVMVGVMEPSCSSLSLVPKGEPLG